MEPTGTYGDALRGLLICIGVLSPQHASIHTHNATHPRLA